jgi:hypothetical protein
LEMIAFFHKLLNTPKNGDRVTLINCIKIGANLFGRSDQKYFRVTNNTDLP